LVFPNSGEDEEELDENCSKWQDASHQSATSINSELGYFAQ